MKIRKNTRIGIVSAALLFATVVMVMTSCGNKASDKPGGRTATDSTLEQKHMARFGFFNKNDAGAARRVEAAEIAENANKQPAIADTEKAKGKEADKKTTSTSADTVTWLSKMEMGIGAVAALLAIAFLLLYARKEHAGTWVRIGRCVAIVVLVAALFFAGGLVREFYGGFGQSKKSVPVAIVDSTLRQRIVDSMKAIAPTPVTQHCDTDSILAAKDAFERDNIAMQEMQSETIDSLMKVIRSRPVIDSVAIAKTINGRNKKPAPEKVKEKKDPVVVKKKDSDAPVEEKKKVGRINTKKYPDGKDKEVTKKTKKVVTSTPERLKDYIDKQ